MNSVDPSSCPRQHDDPRSRGRGIAGGRGQGAVTLPRAGPRAVAALLISQLILASCVLPQPSSRDDEACVLPNLAVNVLVELRRALRAAGEQRVVEAKEAASLAGDTGDLLHEAVFNVSKRGVLDRPTLDPLNSIGLLGQQGAFLFEEAALDSPNRLPDPEGLAGLESLVALGDQWAADARSRMAAQGYGPCWPDATPPEDDSASIGTATRIAAANRVVSPRPILGALDSWRPPRDRRRTLPRPR